MTWVKWQRLYKQQPFFLKFLKTSSPKEILRRVLKVYENIMTMCYVHFEMQ